MDHLRQPAPITLAQNRTSIECVLRLLPTTLLVRSAPWLVILAVIYYGMVLLAIMMDSTATTRQRTCSTPPRMESAFSELHLAAHQTLIPESGCVGITLFAAIEPGHVVLR